MISIVRGGIKKNIPGEDEGIRKEVEIRTYNVDLGNGEWYNYDKKLLLIPGTYEELNKYLRNE